VRAVEVSDPDLGIVGRCDELEVEPDGRLVVVEHKATPVRRRPIVTDAMRIQLALQVRALEAAGHRVAGQVVYFANHRVRVPVVLGDDDRAAAIEWVASTRSTIESSVAPPPLEDDLRCTACSHVGVCLPDERAETTVARRIIVADPDGQVVHLATPGSRASTRGGRLLVHQRGEVIASIPLERIVGLVVHGNVDLSGGLIRELLWHSQSVVWCSGSGRVLGWARPAEGPNCAARVRQHELSALGRIDLAREFVGAKIANQATLLRRNGQAAHVVPTLRVLARRASTADSLTDLLGIEGEAAAGYFRHFSSMLSSRVRAAGITFRVRSGRGAPDRVNASLNYAYALVLADVIRALVACGLDPHAGFLHSSTRNKPALALDLSEEFRAAVADSTVISAFNNGELGRDDFSMALGTARLRQEGRRKLIAAYERRVLTEFRHPVFGYRVTWRRAMEIQARMVLGVIDGTQPRYIGIRVR
jgi:CRISPR-associated protein Cas1